MGAPRQLQYPTVARLRELLSYDPETGTLRWRVSRGRAAAGDIAGFRDREGYVRVKVDRVLAMAHRVVWEVVHGDISEGMQIDHRNGDRSDNSIENLRLVTPEGNVQNQRRPKRQNKVGYLGVSQFRGKYRATIVVAGKQIYLGAFDSPEEAQEAYTRAKRNLHPACTI